MNKGWVCPKCNKVFAPYVPECNYCNKDYSSLFSCINDPEVMVKLPEEITGISYYRMVVKTDSSNDKDEDCQDADVLHDYRDRGW